MFENVTATSAFKNTVTAALKSGKLSHAIILQGGEAEQRLSAAKEIAAYVLCKGSEKPCKSCNSCKKIENCTHPDIHFLKKEENSSMIKVDAIRELKKKALVFPNDGEKSIFIIENAEEMNPQAQNALLKIFEEPSKHLLFILCCGSKASLLDTVISRAAAYTLGEISTNGTSQKNSEAIAMAEELLIALTENNELEFLKKIAVFQKDKVLFKEVSESMLLIVRDAFILQHKGSSLLTPCLITAEKLKKNFTQKKVLELYKCIESFVEDIKINPNYNLTLTRFSALLYSIKSN